MRPLSITFLHASTDLYGSDRALIALARTLDDRGHQIQVVVPQGDGPLLSRLTAAGLRFVQLPAPILRRSAPLRVLPDAVATFTRHRRDYGGLLATTDLIHVNVSTVLTPWMAGRRIPVVWHVREWLGGRGSERLLALAIARRASAVVATSGAVARAFEQAAAPLHTPVRVVPDALLEPDAAGGWNAPVRGRPVVACIGRLLDWKGQDVLLQALAHLPPRTVDVWLAGGPPRGREALAARLRALARQLGRGDEVVFLGEVPSGEDVMRASDVVVVPSTKPEPFGLVVLEAFRAGVPVVATAHGGPAEIIRDGWNGLLVPPRDHVALAGAIGRLLEDAALRSRLVAEGRYRLEDYTVDRTADGVEAAYDLALSRSRAWN